MHRSYNKIECALKVADTKLFPPLQVHYFHEDIVTLFSGAVRIVVHFLGASRGNPHSTRLDKITPPDLPKMEDDYKTGF